MKYIYTFMIAILCIVYNGDAQWEKVPMPDGARVTGINNIGNTIIAYNKCYSSSYSRSRFWVSTDKGESWKQQDTLLPDSFYDILFYDNSIYTYYLGSNLSCSNDLGKSWHFVESPLPGIPKKLDMFKDSLLVWRDGGLCMSGDKGKSWIDLKTSLDGRYAIGGGAYKNDTIYAAFYNTYNGSDIKILRNTDRSKHWDTLSSEGLPECAVTSFCALKDTLYLATTAGLYISYDNYSYWEPCNDYNLSGEINKIKIFHDSIVVLSNTRGAYLSVDNGSNWQVLTDGLSEETINDILFAGEYLYACTDIGIYRKNVSENTWQFKSKGLAQPCLDLYYQSGNLYAIRLNDAGTGLLMSKDKGVSWNVLNTGNYRGNIGTFEIKDSLIIAGGYNNTYKLIYSKDCGQTWNDAKNDKLMSKTFIISDIKVFKNKIFVASNFGLLVSSDTCRSWKYADSNTASCMFLKIFADGEILYAGTNDSRILRSTDAGTSWTQDSSFLAQSYALLSLCRTTSGSLFAAPRSGSSLLKSIDNGISWSVFDTNIPLFSPPKLDGGDDITSLESRGDNIFASTQYNGIYLSRDNGLTWHQIAHGDGFDTTDIECMKICGDSIYAICDGLFASGLFRAPLSAFNLTSVSDEMKSEWKPFFYNCPPYPQPAKNIIKTKIYWDKAYSLDISQISIYDINGCKINTSDNLSFEPADDCSGTVIWNCANISAGVYVITVSQGNYYRSFNVVIQ